MLTSILLPLSNDGSYAIIYKFNKKETPQISHMYVVLKKGIMYMFSQLLLFLFHHFTLQKKPRSGWVGVFTFVPVHPKLCKRVGVFTFAPVLRFA